MVVDLDPHYEHLTFMSPLSESRADRLVKFLADAASGAVVDIGCGWGELLLRVVESAPQLRGIGLDTNSEAIAHARELAARRALDARVSFVDDDAKSAVAGAATAAICIGASQAWASSKSDNDPMDYHLALRSLRSLVTRGGRVVYGEGIWAGTPTATAIAPLAGRADEFVSLAELVDIAVSCGFMPLACHEATLDEWDVFESGYSARYAAWIASHPPDHPDAEEVRESARRQRLAYLSGYRGILGMAYLELIAT